MKILLIVLGVIFLIVCIFVLLACLLGKKSDEEARRLHRLEGISPEGRPPEGGEE